MRWLRRLGRASGLVGLLVALAVAVPLDATIHDLTFRYVVSHELRLVANGLTALGTAWLATGLLGVIAVAGHRAGDAALVRAALGGIVGVAATGIATELTKQAACRARPRLVEGWGVGAAPDPATTGRAAGFGFFRWPCFADSRFHSFPSGHAATAFAAAAALLRAAPARRRLWLAVATGVAASRVLLNAHFVSDVLGGAALGWWVGHLGQALADRVLLRVTPAASPPEARSG